MDPSRLVLPPNQSRSVHLFWDLVTGSKTCRLISVCYRTNNLFSDNLKISKIFFLRGVSNVKNSRKKLDRDTQFLLEVSRLILISFELLTYLLI